MITRLHNHWVLRRLSRGAPAVWTEVRGENFVLTGFESEKMFVYRDDLLCFIVHEETGLAVGVGINRADAKVNANQIWANTNRQDFRAQLAADAALVNAGPKPT